MSNQDIAANVSLEQALRERKTSARGWHWRKGVVLFPEVRCPFCKDVVKSKAVWLISQTQLLGQGVPVSGKEFVLDEPRHPHATPSDICFGDAVDAMQALFSALNPESEFIDTAPWLRGKYWRHECEEMDERSETFVCESCEARFPEDDHYIFGDDWYCESCFNEVAFYCYNCNETYDIDDAKSSPNGYQWCYGCWSNKYFECYHCDKAGVIDEQMTGADDESYCQECYDDRFFYCDTCSEVRDNSDSRGEDGECSECYEEPEDDDTEDEVDPSTTDALCFVCQTTPTSIYCDECLRSYCLAHAEVPCGCDTAQQELPLESDNPHDRDEHDASCNGMSPCDMASETETELSL